MPPESRKQNVVYITVANLDKPAVPPPTLLTAHVILLFELHDGHSMKNKMK
jgi:hypothetical protein